MIKSIPMKLLIVVVYDLGIFYKTTCSQFYMINVSENQWLSVTKKSSNNDMYRRKTSGGIRCLIHDTRLCQMSK